MDLASPAVSGTSVYANGLNSVFIRKDNCGNKITLSGFFLL